jgi:hypothetical protein
MLKDIKRDQVMIILFQSPIKLYSIIKLYLCPHKIQNCLDIHLLHLL